MKLTMFQTDAISHEKTIKARDLKFGTLIHETIFQLLFEDE